MRLQSYFFLLFGMFFIILNCKKQVVNGTIQPDKVQFLPAVSDTCRVERGIDTIPEGDAIFLQWIPGSGDIIRGYEIYRSDVRLGPYQQITDPYLLVQSDSVFIDYLVTIDKKYYYYILAVSDDDVQSDPSDTLNYKLIEKADQMHLQEGAVPSKPLFRWKDPTGWGASPYYIIRLIDVAADNYIWISKVDPLFSEFQEVQYNADGSATLDSLVPGIIYDWRIDISGSSNNCGSESQWVRFQL
jgi:hypothetical protein